MTGPIPILSALLVLSGLCIGSLMHDVAKSDRAARAKEQRVVLAPRAAPERTADTSPARLEPEKSARDERERRRCEKLVRREWSRLQERVGRRAVTSGEARRAFDKLPSRCRDMLAQR